MKKILFLILLPLAAQANDFYVQDEIADMVEDVVHSTLLKINISDMRNKYIYIDRIDGMDVCAREARHKVMQLQAAFSQHPNLFRTRSVHAVYLRQDNGKVSFTPLNLTTRPASCEHLTVSIR